MSNTTDDLDFTYLDVKQFGDTLYRMKLALRGIKYVLVPIRTDEDIQKLEILRELFENKTLTELEQLIK